MKNLSVPAWLFIVAIVAQLVLAVLCAHLLWSNHQPKGWSLDSTQYYKNLNGQGKLNLRLYEQSQAHEARLRSLDKKRQARHRHIDSLSGDALQSEIDRQYNNRPGRQQPTSGASPGDGPQADPANRSGRPSGSEGQSGLDHAARRGEIPGYIIGSEEPGHSCPGQDDYAVEQRATGKSRRIRESQRTGRRLPEEVARSEVGELGRTTGRSSLGGDKVKAAYWRLMRSEGYVYPDVAFAISAVETGYWWIPPPGNNLFGMKKNGRGFYASLSPTNYCRYKNESASLADYGAYEQQVIAKYDLRSRAAYLAHIRRRFCPTASYKGKLDLAFQKLATIRPLT